MTAGTAAPPLAPSARAALSIASLPRSMRLLDADGAEVLPGDLAPGVYRLFKPAGPAPVCTFDLTAGGVQQFEYVPLASTCRKL